MSIPEPTFGIVIVYEPCGRALQMPALISRNMFINLRNGNFYVSTGTMNILFDLGDDVGRIPLAYCTSRLPLHLVEQLILPRAVLAAGRTGRYSGATSEDLLNVSSILVRQVHPFPSPQNLGSQSRG
jgi:hypothetical protein